MEGRFRWKAAIHRGPVPAQSREPPEKAAGTPPHFQTRARRQSREIGRQPVECARLLALSETERGRSRRNRCWTRPPSKRSISPPSCCGGGGFWPRGSGCRWGGAQAGDVTAQASCPRSCRLESRTTRRWLPAGRRRCWLPAGPGRGAARTYQRTYQGSKTSWPRGTAAARIGNPRYGRVPVGATPAGETPERWLPAGGARPGRWPK